jgi:spore coat polysaccharide biosynthesis protein SpsF
MTAVFLQVRLSSQRFPGKALAELSGRTVIEHAMRALQDVPADRRVILTDEESEAALAPYASRAGFGIFVGDPDDVLSRYAAAVTCYNPDTVVRATGDNPLVSSHVARATLDMHRETQSDYTALTGGPLGTGVEVIRARALLEAAEAARDPYEREHVTPYLYRHPERFRLCIETVPSTWGRDHARVTLDTTEDYEELRQIFEELYAGGPIDIGTLVAYLRRNGNGVQGSRRHSA